MISVVLAAYKGEKYIVEQVKSILCQLGPEDEVIISDDYPQGKTFGAMEDIISSDGRVRYIHGKGRGVIKNFEYGIEQAKGDYIFLSDQDDVWLPDKVENVMAEFKNGATLVMHNANIVDGELKPVGEDAFTLNGTGCGVLKNIIKNSYQGCCMAFNSQLRQFILPFPDNLPMHDQWIGLMGEKHGKVALIEKPCILYRRHGENVSGNGSTFIQKIKWRIAIAVSVIKRCK